MLNGSRVALLPCVGIMIIPIVVIIAGYLEVQGPLTCDCIIPFRQEYIFSMNSKKRLLNQEL